MDVRGFEATVSINGSTIKTTNSDIKITDSRTSIELRDRASELVRCVPGMRTVEISFTVLAGIDKDDPNSVDGYHILQEAYESGGSVSLTFTSPSGFTLSGDFVVPNFDHTDPIDELSYADVIIKPSGLSDGSSST